jgi:hypothetical protein
MAPGSMDIGREKNVIVLFRIVKSMWPEFQFEECLDLT